MQPNLQIPSLYLPLVAAFDKHLKYKLVPRQALLVFLPSTSSVLKLHQITPRQSAIMFVSLASLLCLTHLVSLATAIVPVPSSYTNGSSVVWITPAVKTSVTGFSSPSYTRSLQWVASFLASALP